MNKAQHDEPDKKKEYYKVIKSIQKQVIVDDARPKQSAEKPLKIDMGFKQALSKVARHKTK